MPKPTEKQASLLSEIKEETRNLINHEKAADFKEIYESAKEIMTKARKARDQEADKDLDDLYEDL